MAHEIRDRDIVDREDRSSKFDCRLLGCFCILTPTLTILKGTNLDPDSVLIPSLRGDIPVAVLTGSTDMPDLVRHKGSLVGFQAINRHIEMPAVTVVVEIWIVCVVDAKVMDRQILVAVRIVVRHLRPVGRDKVDQCYSP